MPNALMLVWGKFLLAMGIIAFAGPALSRYGDAIARHTGLSGSWIGLLLLATATSLPELFTGVSAVAFVNSPDIAIGNIFGSCIFNLGILVALDALNREESVFRARDESHILAASFGIILIGVAGGGLQLAAVSALPTIFHISIFTPLLILIYLGALRAIFRYGAKRGKSEDDPPATSLVRAIIGYLAAAALVVGAGAWLPFIGQELAERMGWGETFVGTLLIAAATSAPEIVVSISALRLGALDMAVSNLLGSNLFNILVLAIDDIFYTKGSLLQAGSRINAITSNVAMIMSGVVIVALLHRPSRRFLGVFSWASVALAALYLIGSYVAYLYGE